ncbi:hypothetical protein ALC56_12457 [Trachymyrmex septentrionalis]|uniref:Uncharacterized protein n=1 Tax=Trachymyrmex septentrionalis TaxID=34720 RepID=A0A195EYL2_9HYME|nr:hypothetical protein ALC56_12457 [Trachymyrmex septentrionalis]
MSEKTMGQVQDMPRPSLSTLMKQPFKERDERIDDTIGVITALSFFALPQSRVHRPYSASFEVCFWHSSKKQEGKGGRDAKNAKERKDTKWTSEDHPRGEQKRRSTAAKDTVISYGSETNDAAERRKVYPRKEDARPARAVARKRTPRDVPGGPRSVETAQRLKARGIILL